MEKKTISVHAISVHLYAILVILLFVLLGVVALKYLHLHMAMKGYTASTIWMNSQNKPDGEIKDYGKIIAVTSAEFVSANELQEYIEALSKDINRDIIVVNTEKKILADANPKNVGLIYGFDTNEEIKMSMADGKPRVFTETSEEFPNGMTQVVVPMKNDAGQVIGAVIVSNSPLSK